MVECGIVRLLPEPFNCHQSSYVFTWSNDIQNKKWAMLYGCETFYNTGIERANVRVDRNFYDNSL